MFLGYSIHLYVLDLFVVSFQLQTRRQMQMNRQNVIAQVHAVNEYSI